MIDGLDSEAVELKIPEGAEREWFFYQGLKKLTEATARER